MIHSVSPTVSMAPPHDQASTRILFSWLLKLRWGAVIAQIILIGAVFVFFEIDIPFGILMTIITFQLLSNFYFTTLQERKITIPEWLFSVVIFLDATLLTLLLYYTGGPMNPFTFIYLMHVVVGAVVMKPSWVWSLAVYTIFSYALLFFLPPAGSPADLNAVVTDTDQTICLSMLEESNKAQEHMKLHLMGMWLAFAVTTIFIVYFVGRIQKELTLHQGTVADLEAAKVRNEKLASLATLAAGAAHEFSTPLSTIAVAAGEMLHYLKKEDCPQELLEDTRLIREQVDRCKEILFQMAADAGEHLGEAVQDFTVHELINNILRTFPSHVQQQIAIDNQVSDLELTIPVRTFSRIIRGLLKNSLDASEPGNPIELKCWVEDQYLFFRVIDQGCGMDQETLDKATEPFYTTKEPGKGLGLGLFLAKSAVERFGGTIILESTTGKGSEVTLSLLLQKILKKSL